MNIKTTTKQIWGVCSLCGGHGRHQMMTTDTTGVTTATCVQCSGTGQTVTHTEITTEAVDDKQLAESIMRIFRNNTQDVRTVFRA